MVKFQCAISRKRFLMSWYDGTTSLLPIKEAEFPSSTILQKPSRKQILTRCLECPEVDIDQYKVDDGRAVLFAFSWFKDITFFQTFPIEDFGIDLWEGKLVHTSPFFCQQEFLWHLKQEKKSLLISLMVCNNFFSEYLTFKRPWMGGWSHWVVQKSQRRWSGQPRVVVEEWVDRGGCRSGHCLLHGSSYSLHPEARKCGQTHLGLRKLQSWKSLFRLLVLHDLEKPIHL